MDLESLAVESGGRKPSIESGLHAALLRFRSDAAAGIHTHQPLASAVALLGVDLPIAEEEARSCLGPRVMAVPYAPSGTWLLVRALRKRLRAEVNAYLLRNHGLICCGPTMAGALSNAERVERAAEGFLRTAIERAGTTQLAREALKELR
jgi:L-fuculose-phosphate aldolase